MNSIDTIQERFDSSKKSHKGKIMSGARERATKQYFKDVSAVSRRKQNKTRFDTFRRSEQPDEKDLLLEDIHIANFLGNAHANYFEEFHDNFYNKFVFNINMCDMFRAENLAFDRCEFL